ncbi:MAG TPA: hypothetical protein VIP52_02245, partial [Candidatus Dormibacteraeota bacterium]
GQNQAIAWTPAHPLDLALKNLDLAAERQHLSLELGLVAVARRDHVQLEAHQRIQQRAHHPSPKSYLADVIGRSPRATSCGAKLDAIFEPHTS